MYHTHTHTHTLTCGMVDLASLELTSLLAGVERGDLCSMLSKSLCPTPSSAYMDTIWIGTTLCACG